MIYVTSIIVTPKKHELNVGDKYDLKAEVCPSNATCKSVHWRSLDSDIAYVSATSGRIHARKEGTTYIYADAVDGSGVYGYMRVKVNQPVTDITITPSPVTVRTGETVVLSATVTPSDATDKSIEWESENENIATVDDSGIVTGVSVGTTTITASSTKYGSNAVAYCDITVVSNGGKTTTFIKNSDPNNTIKNIRSSCSAVDNSNIVGALSRNDQVELLLKNVKNDGTYIWHKVLYNDSEAYIAATTGLEEITRWVPDFETITPIVDNRHLTQSEMQNNAKIIYQYLYYRKGWSKNAICAAIANMQAESTLSPGRIEISYSDNDGDFAYGLLQWDPPTKWTDYATEHGYTQNDIYRQIDYLVYSMKIGGGEWIVDKVAAEYQLYAYEYIVSDRTPFDLAVSFLLCYERPTNSGTDVRNYRGNLAADWLEFFNELGW